MNQAWLLGQTERNFKLSTKWTWIVSADFLSSKLIFFTVLNSTTIWENPGLTKVLPEGGTNLTRQYLQCNMGIMLICSINVTETSSWSSKFTLKIQTQSFYSHDAMLAGVLDPVYVHPSQIGVLSKRLNDMGWFLVWQLPSTYDTLY